MMTATTGSDDKSWNPRLGCKFLASHLVVFVNGDDGGDDGSDDGGRNSGDDDGANDQGCGICGNRGTWFPGTFFCQALFV